MSRPTAPPCRHFGRFVALLTALLLSIVSGGALALNTVQAENAKTGNSDWELSLPASNRQIEGYASLTSVNRGGSINLFVSTTAPSYTIEVYRLGWYNGAGARKVLGPITQTGILQPVPAADEFGTRDCNWSNPYTLVVPNTPTDPTDWASGVYLAKLTAKTGYQSYIIFTVRDDARASDYLFQSSVNTWQAYNVWGGQSLYAFNSQDQRPARKVSFNRPYDRNYGTGDFLGSVTGGWEINMLRFIEREGYDVTYSTNVDLHEQGTALLNSRKALLSVGHDEYWSYQMRDAAQKARDQGKHLGFFGANNVYWQVRYENANRTLVGFKEAAASSDPYALDADQTNDKLITARFRDLPYFPYNVVDGVARPENSLIGVMYHGDPFDGDMIVSDATNPAYANTNVANGEHLPGLLGYETDSKFDNNYAPAGLQTLTTSPDTWGFSHMVTYTAPSGAIVFSTGSMQWLWGLDDFNAPGWGALSRLNTKAQQTTGNVLASFAAGAAPPPPPPPPPPTPPEPPSNLTASASGVNIRLTWTQSTTAGIAKNTVYRATSGSGPYALIATVNPTTSYTDNKLKKGTYYYVVKAVNASGVESASSNQAVATAGGSAPK